MSNKELSLFELRQAVLQKKIKERIENRQIEEKKQIREKRHIIPRNADQQTLPLSWAQQRLWLLAQLDPAAQAAYHIPGGLRLQGYLNLDALQAALNRIVARHEILRTTIKMVEGQALQVIGKPDSGFSLAVEELSHLPAEKQQITLEEITQRETSQPFDFAQGPLIRGRLLRLAANEHILLLTQHHIISDGWSLNILMHELSTLYHAFSEGQGDPLPALTLQYADYALWQREWLQGELLEKQVNFWRDALQGAPALLELPTDRPRPEQQSYAGGYVDITLSPELSSGLRSLSQRHGTTLFMTLMAGWITLLSRLSGQKDLVVGTPVANRQYSELEPLIGFFVNTLALRIQIDDNPTVSALLARVKAHALNAYAHQDLPFEQLVEVLKPPRSLSHSPIFQVMMSVDNTPGQQNIALPDITISEINLAENSSHFDLSLSINDTENGLVGGLEYSSDLFDHASVERIASYLQTLLTAMVKDDSQPVESLPLLQSYQRTQVLDDFNDTAFPYPQTLLIHQLFEQQVEQTPDATALVFGDSQLSYAELNRHANQLAHHLIASGVRPDDRVAICADRSLDLIIGLYAILKAGAGYIPLDPEYPAERLAYQLSDSKPVLLLTQQHLQTHLPIQETPVWLLDDQYNRDNVAKQPAHNPDTDQLGLKPHHLAYIIYTSGSTGQPKGVMLEHRNVVNFIHAQHQTSKPQLGDRILQFATIAFDTSVSDIFPTLASGATLVLRPPHIRIPDMTFVTFLRKQKITIMDMPTAFWHLWVQEMMAGRSGFSPHLHTLIVGGEKAEYRHLISWLSHQETQSCRWINSYGPTETTVIATTLKLDHQNLPQLKGVIPIGYPLPNTRIYILDTHGQPVPIGVSGEIHIAGAGVARGYLNRPDLTAEKFVADPFSTQPDARMYKTGDLGRWLPDGAIEYLGRNDFQVKLRGFRIELGEIETQLVACAGVSDAVVIAREEESGDKRLIAYVIPETGMTLSPAELRKQLSSRLMEHMLPSAFVMLDAFPMSANGKLDRKALPAPDQSAIVSREYEVPQGETEQTLAAIWQSLLNVEQIGRQDNFFELGGHSLLVVNLIEQVRLHGLSLDVNAVFSAPTLAAMSSLIRHHDTQSTPLQDVPPNLIKEDSTIITPDMLPLLELTQDQIDQIVSHVTGGISNVQDIYPLGPLQEGILFHHLLETEGDLYLDNHLMIFDSRTRLESFLQALQQVIERHDILRSAVYWKELLKPVQIVYRHAPLPIIELTLSTEEPPETQLRRLTDPRAIRMDITKAPLLSAHIANDPASGKWLLSLLYHHLVCDHISLDMIFSEIQTLLLGESENLPTPLPYRNFIAQIRNVPLEVHQNYFRELLGDVEEPTLPFGLLDVQGGGLNEIVENVLTLDSKLAQNLRDCARQLGMSAAVLFHVAWAQVLARCSGRNDVVFGTVLLGRLQGGIGASEVLGMFINTLPIRVKLQARTVKQTVQETYQQLTALLDHEQAPLAVAQRCSGIQAPLPLFNSLLNFRHSPREDEHVAAMAWEGIDEIEGEERSNYPLSLDVDDFDDGFALTAQCNQQINPVRITAYMKTALEGIVAALQYAPEQAIETIDILSRAERTQLLETFNDNVVTYPQDALIHQLLEQQAARTPDAIALVFGESELSYAALNRQANQLAHQLIAAGVCPDDRVAICVDRSLDLIIGLYAILKAGAGYVPLDPEYPAERLAYQLSDSKPVLLLTQRPLQGLLPISDTPVWLLDDESQRNNVAKQPIHNPDIQLQPHHLAYIIYTSGSTGQPKGVMLEHRNVVNFIHAQHQTSEPQSGDRILQFATIAFDTSVSDIFPTLAAGATLVLRPPHIRIPDMTFVTFLREQKITIIDMPTAFWHLWVQEMMAGRSGFSPYLHTLIVGGEKAEYRHLISWLSHQETQSCRWINSYGPTETTVIATTLKVDGTSTLSTDITDNIPIGYPLPNTRIYILDTHGRPVPLGVSGEIHIGGAGVARGYLNRPDLTAEKFVADPFSTQPDARMYKTGDLGRWLPDGAIEYLGRNDFQIKIRGFRIELGEIETQLLAYKDVHDAVVIAREEENGDKRLIAYVIPKAGSTLKPAELREHLSARLLEYMLPRAFVILDAFPMSANGKLDRKALPAPDQNAIVSREYEAPQGETEQKLAAVWQSLLELEQVGRHDNFFELGGHSLLVVSLIEQLRQQGLSLAVSAVFAAPTLAAMSARLHQKQDAALAVIPPNLIREDSPQITPAMLPLVTLTQAQIDRIVDHVPGGVANIQDIYPLGPLQEGILFHHLLTETGDTYLENILMHFDNRPRLTRFLQALQQVIDRHDIQRSAFHWQELPIPVQVVYRHAPLPITELTLSAGERAETQLRRLTDPDSIRLDITQAPLLAAYIARDPDTDQWWLSLLHHHLVCDHLSLEIIFSEVQTLILGEAAHLPAPLPYRNFIAQTRQVPIEVHQAYFQQLLGDVEEPTLPFGLLDVQGNSRDKHDKIVEDIVTLDEELAQQIRNCARQLGISAAVLFHVAWAQVLAQCSGREDVVFGTVLLGRLQGGMGASQVLGMFINTLPVRIPLQARTVKQAVQETYQRLSELLDHEQTPLAIAQRCSGVPASLPLFNSLLNFRHSPRDEEAAHSLAWDGIQVLDSEERSNYPLSLDVDDFDDGFALTAQCSQQINPVRITAYMKTALEGIVAALQYAPEQPIHAIDILPRAERTQLLETFNDTIVEYPQDALIHQLFEQQATRTPDAIALVFGENELSYAALNRQANQLAHQLIAAGVRPDDRVAICVDRSLDLIIGLYAILKAGAGYVPLDPEYPTERLAYQLSDSKPVLLLTQSSLQGLLPISDMPVWLLDDESQRNNVAKQPIHNPDIQLQPHHLAYIIYTSGSTGQPKGVMLEHRNVVNFIHAQHQTSEPQSGDRILQFATIAFDTSVSDIFPTLAAGATLVLRPPHIRIPDMTFVTFLREQKITIIDMPTAFWHLWVQEMMAGRSGFSPYLHTLIVGGEKAEYRHLINWLSHQETQSCRWINSYGPTETTVIATTLKLDHQNLPQLKGVIPIGYPLPNTRIYILDTHGRPVPLGVSGEIHIGGAGVARGYLNRPDLTAEKFVADPFSIQPDARMYKTGDLGRWLPDGAIEYLGRNDFQIKIRGFRIELGEIETQLLACEDVHDAVVIAREEESGDKRLIAYVIPKAGSTLKPAELREHLSSRLLEYMLPRAFVILDAFPMSANGKLDRKALPAPDQSAIVSREYEAPQGETEQKLAAVWQSLLELEQVGRHDNFFELGGHSLLVVSLIEQLRQQGLSLAVSAVFAAPTLAAMSARLHQKQDAALAVIPPNLIREDSPQITPAMLPLVTLTQAQIDRIVDHVPGGVANIQDIYPLGPLQEGILFHHLLTETGDTYLENILMHFDNRPRLTRFLQALQQVIDRHDIQRSAFHWQELPIPVQVVYRHAPLPITELTLSAGERAETQLRRLTDPDSIRLDITQAPLLAAYIARDPDTDQWWLSLLHHHLVCDHLSLEIIFSEVQALILGEAAHLPAPLPYRNFIAQTRQVPIEVHQAYFQQLLGDVEEPTLPFGLLDVQGNSRDKHDKIVEDIVTLDEELAQQIRNCARQLGISAAVLFHVAWAQVLAQCGGREDVVFGTVLLGRLQGGMGASQVLGMFINTLPVRIPLQARTVKQAVQETYQRLSELLDHEQTPLAIAQRCSGVPASLPLFNSLLNFRHSPRDEEATHSLAWDGIQVLDSEERSNYPLSLDVDDFDDGFALTAQCSQQINPVRITAYMKTALEGIVAALQYAPEQPIHAIDILPRAERTQLLEGFNDTAIDSPQDALIHQLFEQQATRTPDAIALVFGENELSYAALNRQANQLAHQLIAAGVRPDDRIAICVDRSLELIIGLYAILKAGAGYVPLDPEYPAERLAYQLSDSKPVLLLTQRSLQGLLPISDTPVWLLDDESQRNNVAKQPIHNPDIQLQPHHLAYIIYTSGSTGQPKGVMLEHRNVVNFIHAQHQTSEPQSGDRILQFATIAFDTSVSDIFPTLAAGATLVLRPPHIRIPDMTFVTFLREQKITIIDMPTAFWHLWVQEMMAGRSGFSPYLHTLIVGGEKAEYRHLISWLSQQETQSCRWINSYGPTETTVIATTLKLDHQNPPYPEGVIPIGYPLPNTRIYILDTHGRPVPVGVSGEIHIGGAGVARGYLNRPDLTAEKFVADPFSTQPDARMYKTGDLGRWLPDGAIEYLGRNDFQIKIRGFRIELGEIETQLLAYEDVSDAVVIAREEENGDKRLIAYVIPKAGSTLKPAELREHLSARLLEYMLPRAFVILDAFPMSANGKLDRKALPAPDQSAIVSREYEAPQGETEQKLAAVWQSLLELEQVGRHDNFFELGGHSLLVVSLIEQLRQQGLSLAVSAVFAAPTLAAMSARLHQKQDAALAVIPPNLIREDSPQITPAMLPLVTLTQAQIDRIVDHVPGGVANIQDIYPLGPLQEGILFHHLLTETGDTYLENILMHFDNRPRLTRFLQALQQVIDRHDIQRSAFHWQELPIPVQVVYRHAPLPITELTLSAGERAETQLRRLTDPDSIRLDITQAPLLAAYIARDPDSDQWWLSLLHHHLVCDHLSLEIIFSEVQALILGEAAHLPAPLPYRNFIAQTRQVPIEVHQAYFQQLLGDVEEPTLPFGLLDVQGNSRDKHDKIVEDIVTLDEELAQQIRDCARQLGISAAVLFHVAWAQVLAQCSGREDVVFGTVLLGRLQGGMGASQVLGMFINTLPVRIPLQARTVKQAVQETYQRLSELLDHEQTPLAIAQRCSGVPASLPLFNSLLNFRHSPRDEEAAHSLAWDGIQVLDSEERSNYPLSLDVDDFDDGFALTAQCSQQINPVRITAYMKTALEGIVAALQYAPEQPIHAIDILPQAERTQLLETFNDTVVEYPQDALIHQLFEQQAARTPDAIALAFGESELSYAALNRQANQLAHQLIAAGVRPDDRIAICVDRSLELIIGLYAILKAGAGYVPLDPEYPAERLAYQLSDSKPVLLLTQRPLQGLLPISDMPVWLLDDESQRNNVAKQPIHNPDIQLQSHHLAYIIYTSGSTGQPKGVMLEHRNVVNFIHAQHQTSEPQSGDRILQFATIAFDTSVSDIFPTLASGATLVLRPAHIRVPDAEFVNLLNKQKITIMDMPTAFWHQWVQEMMAGRSGFGQYLRTVIVGGEKAELRHLISWQSIPETQSCRWINSYGPTETTVIATTLKVDGTSTLSTDITDNIPIGYPLPNTRIYILDTFGKPVPLGVSGEIHIGGAGVARGYLNRPDLTAEKFVADPFSKQPDARMYKTGDLGRWLPDGAIEYLGRNDFQVKLRGFRIELGEIETRLVQCQGVQDAIVLIREITSDDKRLVAYVQPESGVNLVPSELRQQLAQQLAEFMLPSAFVILDAFPLTSNGKIDRQAFPAPDQSAIVTRDYEAPQGEVEITLAQIWQDLLGVERVSRHDHFFELGGHSLLILKASSLAIEKLGLQQNMMASLMTFTTIKEQARAIEDRDNIHVGSMVGLSQNLKATPLFFAPGAGGHVLYLRELATALEGIYAVWGMQSPELDGRSDPPSYLEMNGLEAMASVMIDDLKKVQPNGPYYLAGHSFGGWLVFEMARQLVQQGESIGLLALVDSESPLESLTQRNESEWSNRRWLAEFGNVLAALAGAEENFTEEEFESMTEEEQLDNLRIRLIEEELLPPQLEAKEISAYLNVFKAHSLATYQPQERYSGTLHLFLANEEYEGQNISADSIINGWKTLVTGEVISETLSGDHITIMRQPFVQGLASAIASVNIIP